jgi:hypothetical protein
VIKEESPPSRVIQDRKRKLKNQKTLEDLPIGEEHGEATTSRGKKYKSDEDIDIFLDREIKMEIDKDEDYTVNPIHSPVKKKHESTSKKNAKGKKQRKKPIHVPKCPRRKYTNSKTMFDPSIKNENLIIIEDNSEDSKTCIKKHEETTSLHMTEKI